MGDYTNPVDEANLRNYGYGNVLEQGNKAAEAFQNLAKLLQQKKMPGIEAAAKSKMADEDVARVKGMKASGLVEEGGSASSGTVHTGANAFARMFQHQQQIEAQQGQKLYGEAKKQIGSIESQLQSVSNMHDLLDNPNAVDQKQLGAMGARLTEGQGQRLLQSLVHELGAPPSIAGNAEAASNWVLGQAQSGLTAAQSNAFRQNLFKHQSMLEQQLQDGKEQFSKSAGLIAPGLTPDKHQIAINAASGHSDNLLKSLHQRQQDYQQRSGTQIPGQMPAQQAQPASIPDKIMSKLGSFLSPSQKSAVPQQNRPMNPNKSDGFDPSWLE